jgi:hypothetical protein
MAILTPENLGATSTTSKRGAIFARWKKLEDDRSSWRAHWSEITDYLLPRRGRYMIESQNTKGRKRSSKIVDNTAGQALRTLSAGMMSGMTSPARPWFRLQTADADMMRMAGVKDWLGVAEREVRAVLSRSNFYNCASTLYTELGAFGTGAMYRMSHPTDIVSFRPFTAGEYVIAEDEYGRVDTLGREFTMTVAQVVERFVIDRSTGKEDWSKVSKAVKNLWSRKAFDEQIEIIHLIQPRRDEDRDLTKRDGKNKPWMDCYIEKGADGDTVLFESGYDKFPAYCPRWDVLGGDIYGVSPAMEQLGDIKQLQHEQKRKAQAIDKMVNPPMVASLSLKGKPATTLPSGVTYVDPQQGSAGFAPAYTVQPRINEMMMDIQEVQGRIQRGFYADLFAMMINSDRRQMTATEVAERHEEKLTLLGPVLQRLNTEFLDPMISDVFYMALAAGRLPPPPRELHGVDVDVKYVSLLAQAQEAVAAAAIERTFSFAGNLVAVFPEITDNIDPDIAFRAYGETLGISPDIIRDDDEVKKLRAARQQAQQQQANMEQAMAGAQIAQTGAQAAKVLSEADTTRPNALTALLQGGGGMPRATV